MTTVGVEVIGKVVAFEAPPGGAWRERLRRVPGFQKVEGPYVDGLMAATFETQASDAALRRAVQAAIRS